MVGGMGTESDQLPPIGRDVARYLRMKRKRLTDNSYRSYEFCLEKFVRHCEDLQPEDFEPPAGMQRLEECLETLWGAAAPAPTNKNLSIIKDFLHWQVKQGHLNGDPTVLIERARSRDVYRPTRASDEQPHNTRLVVPLPRKGRRRGRRNDQQRADAQGPLHRRPASTRQHRQHQGSTKLLGHASIRITGDLYTDWDITQLEATLTEVLDDEN